MMDALDMLSNSSSGDLDSFLETRRLLGGSPPIQSPILSLPPVGIRRTSVLDFNPTITYQQRKSLYNGHHQQHTNGKHQAQLVLSNGFHDRTITGLHINGNGVNGHDSNQKDCMRRLVLVCTLCQSRMQAIVDLLLLTDDVRPVRTASLSVFGESLSRCRETIGSRSRGLSVLLRDLVAMFRSNKDFLLQEISTCVEEMCELVVSLTECCAHAAYLLAVLQDGSTPEIPGAVDRYCMCRSAAELEHRYNLLRSVQLENVTALMLTDLSNQASDNAGALADMCLKASEVVESDALREQFKLSTRSINANLNAFISSVKKLRDAPNHHNYRTMQVFSEALVTTCNAVTVFATQDESLIGKPARLSRSGRDKMCAAFSACMCLVSPCILACSVTRELAYSGLQRDPCLLDKLEQCHAAVIKGASKIAEALEIPNATLK